MLDDKGIIVFGPAACGKSYNADALRRHFDLQFINHDWSGRDRLRDRPGTLVLTTADLSGITYDGFRVISFADAMREAGLPNNYRHGRKWLPSDWMDEMPPQTGAAPDAFLRRHPDTGTLQLWPLDASNHEPESIGWMVRDLKDGDVVSFMWHEGHGGREMAVKADGSWTLDKPFPDSANCFDDDDGNWEVIGNLDAVASTVHGSGEGEFPRLVGVIGWTWSAGSNFRLVAGESGAAHFVEVTS